jgi:hypothetical protein
MEKDYLEDSNSTNSDSLEDVKDDVLIIRRDNENYDIRFGNNITSGELIFLIKYLKNTALPSLVRKEID